MERPFQAYMPLEKQPAQGSMVPIVSLLIVFLKQWFLLKDARSMCLNSLLGRIKSKDVPDWRLRDCLS